MHFNAIEARAWRPNSLHPFWGFFVRVFGWGFFVHAERPDEPFRAGWDKKLGISRPVVIFFCWHWLRPFEWRGD